ncbi:MAG: DNA primase [Gemmatimonadaceae bacterium]|nr:DNA primase [Gemmatimonadaceae bacterium]
MIPQETIERIRDAADLVAIIGESVKLRKVGADFRGPCPFHGGKNPNFSVSTRNNTYHCFKCGESGDVFTYFQKQGGMDWPTAVRAAADRAGIVIVEKRGSRDEMRDAREPVWSLLGAAAALFTETLWSQDGAAAQAYLASRGLDKAACERFELGFAPADADLLRTKLGALGYSELQLLDAGLLVRRDEDGKVRARFRNRVMFPIHDAAGHPVGFGGRLMGPGEPKYLNSSDSPVFSKGQLLYGLHWAKNSMRKEEQALVVEGYMDVIRCHLAGATHAVAGLGTALTEGQAQLLARYTTNVYLLYDSDEAGQKATFKAGMALLQQKAAVRVVTLPDGDDPDTFVRQHGRQGLDRALHASVDIFGRQLQLMEQRGWFNDIAKSRIAIDKVLPTLRATADHVTRAIYVKELAAKAGIPVSVIEEELAAAPKARASAGPAPARRATPRGESSPSRMAAPDPFDPHIYEDPPHTHEPVYETPKVQPPPLDAPPRGKWQKKRQETGWKMDPARPRPGTNGLAAGPELSVVALLIQDRRWTRDASEQVDAALFEDERLRVIYEVLLRLGSDEPLDAVELQLGNEAPYARDVFLDVVARTAELAPSSGPQVLAGAVRQFRVRQLERTLRELDQGIRDESEPAARRALELEREALRIERRGLLAERFRN